MERTRKAKLKAFQRNLAGLKFLDPVCDSGNFLTETYISLRQLGARRSPDLRRIFATMALQNGVDIKTVSGMLGHHSTEFTLDVCANVTKEMQKDAAQ